MIMIASPPGDNPPDDHDRKDDPDDPASSTPKTPKRPVDSSSRKLNQPRKSDPTKGPRRKSDRSTRDSDGSKQESRKSKPDRKADRLARAREAARQKRERYGKLRRKNPVEKRLEKPTSRKLAMDAKCWDCSGRDADPHVQWRIANCPILDCDLYGHRPHQRLFGRPMPPGLE